MTDKNTDNPNERWKETSSWRKVITWETILNFVISYVLKKKTANKILKMANTALSNVHLYLSFNNLGKTNTVYSTFKNVSRVWINH